MQRQRTVLILAAVVMAVIAAGLFMSNLTGNSGDAGQPSPHALDQTN